jgi:hypothetical protein
MRTLGYEGQLIINFLKSAPDSFFSGTEIARKAGQKGLFRENPDWAKPVLFRLVEEDFVETDAYGHYRLIPDETQKTKTSLPLAPHIAEILARSERVFDLTHYFLETPKGPAEVSQS